MVCIFLCCLVKRTKNTEFLLASMETLTNPKNVPETRIIISVLASLSVIGQFPPVSTSHWT
jgi:hypothetical protein